MTGLGHEQQEEVRMERSMKVGKEKDRRTRRKVNRKVNREIRRKAKRKAGRQGDVRAGRAPPVVHYNERLNLRNVFFLRETRHLAMKAPTSPPARPAPAP